MVVDQIVKAYIVSAYAFDTPSPVVDDWLRIVLIHNSGGLFGILQNQVQSFALISVVVVAFLVALELRSGWRNWVTTLALGLLLGGAIGNFIDRVALGYVRDFFDIGIGTWRFYIFNVADMCVTVAIGLVFLLAFLAPHSVFLATDNADGRPPAGADPAERSSERLDA